MTEKNTVWQCPICQKRAESLPYNGLSLMCQDCRVRMVKVEEKGEKAEHPEGGEIANE